MITSFICGQLQSKCKANQAAISTCKTATSAADAATKEGTPQLTQQQPTEVHVETALKHEDAAYDAEAKGQRVSGYEELTFWQTVSAFKMATFICLCAAFSAGADGYQMA